MHTRAAITILGAAIIDDVLGLIVLSLVVSETSAGSNLLVAIVPMGLTIVGVWVRPALAARPPGPSDRDAPPARRRARRACSGSSWPSPGPSRPSAGLAGITGAYVAGLALSGSVGAPRGSATG